MINTNVFDYANILEKAADAASLRQEAISNNIANATTPGYKRQDITFEKVLQRSLRHSKFKSLGQKVSNLDLDSIDARTYKDYPGFAYRRDQNNVDPETEQAMLAKNQIKYKALIQCINGEFSSLKSAMK